MSDIAVSVRGLGKRYHLGAARERYSTLRDSINKFTSAPLRRLLRRAKAAEKNPPFWALKDVTFDVKRGEVVGIIGRNGAGKSTLLKILSRITEPTEGEADIHGRVGSLLEVGTGFHPELTGRENVYLNGAILGMRRSEIARKFDEIVAFAEVEKFIDTPVKHYSSGMYMRLAFAVAAHLEPEVLIVDEVLAVGDAQFQKKCLGKMGDVARGGRTVLFVSHNMAAVAKLCGSGILLHQGQVQLLGSISDVTSRYQDIIQQPQTTRQTTSGTKFLRAWVTSTTGENVWAMDNTFAHWMIIEIDVDTDDTINIGFTLYNSRGVAVCSSCLRDGDRTDNQIGRGSWCVAIPLPSRLLTQDEYRLEGAVWSTTSGIEFDQQESLLAFTAMDTFSSLGRQNARPKGQLLLGGDWEVRRRSQEPSALVEAPV